MMLQRHIVSEGRVSFGCEPYFKDDFSGFSPSGASTTLLNFCTLYIVLYVSHYVNSNLAMGFLLSYLKLVFFFFLLQWH